MSTTDDARYIHYFTAVSGLNAWIVVFGVEHEEYVCMVITYSRVVWINRVKLPILLVVS